jgi:hypothetical protein
MSSSDSGIQINPNREQLCTEETNGGGIAGATRQLVVTTASVVPDCPLAQLLQIEGSENRDS